MSPPPSEVSRDRPVLLGHVGEPRPVRPPRGGGNSRVGPAGQEGRRFRIDTGFEAALEAMRSQVNLATSINAADPQLVLVMEAVEDQTQDLAEVAGKLGIEVLRESEDAMDSDEEFPLASEKPRDPFLHTSLHAVCTNQAALNHLLGAWRHWKQHGQVSKNAKLRDFFSHLRDVRPWGPHDRIKLFRAEEYLEGLLLDQMHPIELELWFRNSDASRLQAQAEVERLVVADGGQIIRAAIFKEIGYHGISCLVSTALLQRLSTDNFDQVQLIKSSNVMYVHRSGQDVAGAQTQSADRTTPITGPLPVGTAAVALLDGVPVANHSLLQGRIQVLDPDDFEEQSDVAHRYHGTHMSSAVVWGGLVGVESSTCIKTDTRATNHDSIARHS